MPELHQPMIPLRVDYVCDACGKGKLFRPLAKLEVIPAGNSGDAGLLHLCPLCHTRYHLPQSYPHLTYVNFYEFVNDARAAVASAKERHRDGHKTAD